MPSTVARLRHELEVLSRLAKSLVSVTELDELVFEITRSVSDVLGFPDCVLYLWDEKTERLVQRAAAGPKLDPSRRAVVEPLRLALGEGIVGGAAALREVQLIDDVRSDLRYIAEGQGGGLSELAVPILFRDRLIGVLDAEHQTANAFTVDDAIVLSRFADLCAAAIVSMQLMEAARSDAPPPR